MTVTVTDPAEYVRGVAERWPWFLRLAEHAERVAVDTETTGIKGIKDGRDYCMGVSLGVELAPGFSESIYLPFRHPDYNLDRSVVVNQLDALLRRSPLVFHNRKFDLHSLTSLGLDPYKFHPDSRDTLIMAQLVNENWFSKKLDALGKLLVGEGKSNKDQINEWGRVWGWDTIPSYLMDEYARQDATLTLKVHDELWKRLVAEELTSVYEVERDYTLVLYAMERLGVGVDPSFAEEKCVEGERRMGAVESQLGFECIPSNLVPFFIDELGLPVLKRGKPSAKYPDGKPSLDKKVMEAYDELLATSQNKAARLVLEFRGWQKAVSSLYRPALELRSPDGLVRTQFNQHGARTGRLSSEGPNLQQIPRDSPNPWNGNAKKLFHAGDSDYELVGYDYSQLEFRLAATYGRDAWLLDKFNDQNADVFTELSQRAGCARQTIKPVVYGTLYGAGLAKIQSTLDRHDPGEVAEIYDAFKESVPGIFRAARSANNLAKKRGWVRYWTGRRRHLPWDETQKAFNSVLQGGGAELVKRAQLRLRDIETDDCRQVLQVHDEVVFKVRKGKLPEYEPAILKAMGDWPMLPVRMDVAGKAWGKKD